MNPCAHCFGDLPEFAVFCPHCARADEPDFNQLLNQIIAGRYRLYRQLGQGGLSTVFAATDLETDRVVVVKVSDPAQLVQRELSYAIDAEAARNYWHEMLERMRIEAETLAAIEHPNIVRFYDTGMLGEDLRFVVMEFLHGRTLRDELTARGRFDSAEAVRIALGICAALSEVHARDIVHRDINPRNIMLESETKLIDFGIAKFPQPPGAPPLTQHSVLSGTVAYASPEQCQSRAVDHRSDIYSLGVVLYEMLTGERPFLGRTPTEIALKQIQMEPAPPRQLNPDLPVHLERSVMRMLAKNPDDRQQDVAQLAEELRSGARQMFIPLQSSQDAEPGAVDEMPEDGSANRLMLVRRRRRRLALAAAALVLVALVSGVLFGRNWLAERLAGSPVANTSSLNPLPSPSPTAAVSDADSLELAAQLPPDGRTSLIGNGASNGTGNRVSLPLPANNAAKISETKPSHAVTANPSSNAGAKPSQVSAPVTRPAKSSTKPQVAAKSQSKPSAPSPKIAATHTPQTNNPPPPKPPEVVQAARKTEDNVPSPRDNANGSNTASGNSTSNSTAEAPPVGRRDRVATNRDRDDSASHTRRGPRTEDVDADAREGQDAQHLGPKLIQWSGSVNREREITIDLPGVPGMLEIPRVYRNRVGIVEPPSPSNRWRTATLRVFGQGGVSFVVRWWPRGNGFSGLNAQRH